LPGGLLPGYGIVVIFRIPPSTPLTWVFVAGTQSEGINQVDWIVANVSIEIDITTAEL
jgi:hypothetical protein